MVGTLECQIDAGHTRIHNSNRSSLHPEDINTFIRHFYAATFLALPLLPYSVRVTLALPVNLGCVLSINNMSSITLLPI